MRTFALVVACALAACAGQETRNQPHDARGPRDPKCLSVRGCPPSAALPSCGANDAPTVAAVLAAATDGQAVAVRGKLAVGELICTQALCPGQCCNSCNGDPQLTADGQHLALTGEELGLRGDDSAVCWRRGRAGEEVIVRGTLSRADGNARLSVSEMCARGDQPASQK
jgi:hypothetical protein